jgi:hypothetical protein
MKTKRIVALIAASVVIVIQLCCLDYSHLTWKGNAGPCLSILAMCMVLVSTIASAVADNKEKKENN